jgi:hypothetical protein
MGKSLGKAINPQNVCVHVGQHHGGKRPRANAGDLNDLQAFEWAHHALGSTQDDKSRRLSV